MSTAARIAAAHIFFFLFFFPPGPGVFSSVALSRTVEEGEIAARGAASRHSIGP